MPKRRTRQTSPRAKTFGKEPPSACDRRIVVLFADIIGCCEMSNHKTIEEYNKFLSDFHSMFMKVIGEHSELYPEHERGYFDAKTRGDEGCLMIFVPGRNDLSEDVDTAVNVALDLKRRWVLQEDNTGRIKQGLLPSNLAIGIHLGKAYVNEGNDGPGKVQYRPEGYAINLAKRIEGHSRNGQFTHIYVSEAARNELYLLTDEATYTFTDPRPIQTKGISRDITVFEVKHHFLPTDWTEDRSGKRVGKGKSRAVFFEPTDEELACVDGARNANPTNLWLAEEYILLKLQAECQRLKEKGEEGNPAKVKEAYQDAESVASRLATGDQRDAGILTIRGLIVGEYENYDEEQRLYKEGLEIDRQYPEAHWYLAYSMSAQLYKDLDEQGPSGVEYDKLGAEEKTRVTTIMDSYKRAIDLNPRQAWVHFDLACELWRWQKRQEAVETLEHAGSLNPAVLEHIKGEPYLDGIEQLPRIKKLLERT